MGYSKIAMNKKILERIIKKSGCSELFNILAKKLSLTDLQSLLLEVYRERAGAISASAVFEQYKKNRFVKPAATAPQKFIEFDQKAFSLMPKGFEAVELSPAAPLGSCSAAGYVDQNNVLTTIRNTEVCADSTNAMALECALRRQRILAENPKSAEEIKLCASHRVLRTQQFDEPAAFPHFRLFALCSAGRDSGSFEFEINSLSEHLAYFISLFEAFKEAGYTNKKVRINIKTAGKTLKKKIREEVIEAVNSYYPEIGFEIEAGLKKNGYYDNLRYNIFISGLDNKEFFIVDGGTTDWTRRFLGSRKERFFISGMGSERFVFCFGSDEIIDTSGH